MATLMKLVGGRPTKMAADDTFTTTGAVATGSLQLGGAGATVSLVDNADLATGSATRLATQGAIKTYVDAVAGASDLDLTSDDGTIDVDLDSETLTVAGAAGITTAATGTTLTVTLGNHSGDLITSGTVAAARVATLNQNTTGSAATLTTARNINGVAFDGSGNITITAAGSTLSDTVPLGKGGTGATSAAGAAAALLDVSQGGALNIGDGSDTITVPGNLTVSGTTTTVSSTVVTVADPLFQLGSDTDDSKDRGITMLYNDGASKVAWMGWDESADKFAMLSAATESGAQVMSGTTGVLVATLEGNVTGNLQGNVTGNVDGNVTGSSGSCTGNAATVTTNANLTGHITSTGNAAVLGSFSKAQLSTAVSDGTPIYSGDTATAATLASTVTVTDSTTNDDYPIVMHDQSNALLDRTSDSGTHGLSYNPSNGTIKFTQLSDGAGLITAADLVAEKATHQFVAGEDIKAGELVTIGSDSGHAGSYGKAFVADYACVNEQLGHYDSIIGVAVADADADANVTVNCGFGHIATKPAAQGALTKGKPVFVGADGALLQAAPTTAGQAVIQVGVATDTTTWMYSGSDIWSVN